MTPRPTSSGDRSSFEAACVASTEPRPVPLPAVCSVVRLLCRPFAEAIEVADLYRAMGRPQPYPGDEL